jgi:hypothetical protein
LQSVASTTPSSATTYAPSLSLPPIDSITCPGGVLARTGAGAIFSPSAAPLHTHNPSRAILDHVLDWRLIHRDEDALNALVRRSAFRTARVTFEQGVVMIAELAKV